MVILLALMYVWGIASFATFIVTRRSLRRLRNDAVSKTEKCLNSLNTMSVGWAFFFALMLSAIEFPVVAITPVHMWPHLVERLNETFSFSTFSVVQLSLVTILVLVTGYRQNPRASDTLANTLGKRSLRALIVWFAVVGILGVLTGILV